MAVPAPALWDVVVIALMLGGATLCLTSLVLAWRVVARTLAARFWTPLEQPDEDLAGLHSNGHGP